MTYIHYIQANSVHGLGGYISKESLKGKSLDELYSQLEDNKRKLEESVKNLQQPNQTPRVKKRRAAFVRFYKDDIALIETEINTRLTEQADAKTRAELEAKNKALAEATAKRDAEHKSIEAAKAQLLADSSASPEAQKIAEAKARAAEKAFLEAEKARQERVNAEAAAAKVDTPVVPSVSPRSSTPSVPSGSSNKINWTARLNQQNSSNSQPLTVFPPFHDEEPKNEWLTPTNMMIGGMLLLLGVYWIKK